MAVLVLKFGGTSVKDVERIKNAAIKVAAEARNGHKIAVVVSAMAGVTDTLIDYCRSITTLPNTREYDAVASAGEQITAGLMAIALEQRGLRARSWQGWQIPLRTDSTHSKARIESIDASALMARLNDGEVAVMAGFQGIAPDGSITTLGRGGSDTSAVALAAAINADRCDIYTDVDGVYSTDPRLVPKASKLKTVTYEEMLELASLGAKVLQTRSVEMGLRYNVPIQVLSTFANEIGSDLPGTIVTRGDSKMEQKTVTGIACSRNDAKITLVNVPDRPGLAAAVFGALARVGISVDTIVQTASSGDGTTDITFTIPRPDLERAQKILDEEKGKIGWHTIVTDKDIVKISLVGIGMRSHPGVAATMFETLAARNINIQAIDTSEISISVLIADEYAELALRALHSAFSLDNDQ